MSVMQNRIAYASDFSPMSHSDALLTIIWVLIVLIIMVVLIVFVIKFLGNKNRMWSRNQAIRTLGAIGLAQNKSLQVIELGDNIYVIGVGDDIRLVDKITDEAEVAAVLAHFESRQAASPQDMIPSLVNMFKKFKKNGNSDLPQEGEPDVSFHEILHNKLNRVSNRKLKVEELLHNDNNADRLMDK